MPTESALNRPRAISEQAIRALTGQSIRPIILIRNSKVFPTDSDAYQAVVLLDISGAIRAVSIRAEQIHGRFRITEIVLISP